MTMDGNLTMKKAKFMSLDNLYTYSTLLYTRGMKLIPSLYCALNCDISSNGMAERAVQTFKLGLKRATKTNVLVELDNFLFHYRITPHTTTGVAPAHAVADGMHTIYVYGPD